MNVEAIAAEFERQHQLFEAYLNTLDFYTVGELRRHLGGYDDSDIDSAWRYWIASAIANGVENLYQ